MTGDGDEDFGITLTRHATAERQIRSTPNLPHQLLRVTKTTAAHTMAA
jgi:hypothetical protein